MKITKEELYKIVESHSRLISGQEDGMLADLSEADLRLADLRLADLSGAKLSGADLREADLRWADLREADLSGADLREADLSGADLREADLSGAKLSGADLREADLSGADLREADLSGADLREADLSGADLSGAKLPKYMYQITDGGSVKRMTTYDLLNNQVICGCWVCTDGNTLENFEKMVKDVYGAYEDKSKKKYYQEYIAAIEFFKAIKEIYKESRQY